MRIFEKKSVCYQIKEQDKQVKNEIYIFYPILNYNLAFIQSKDKQETFCLV